MKTLCVLRASAVKTFLFPLRPLRLGARISSPTFVLFVSFVVSLLFVAPALAAQAQLSWQDNSTNEDGFAVERRIDAGSYVEIGRVGVNVQGYLDPALAEGSRYCYRVLAFNRGGISPYSNEACLTIPFSPPDGAPTNAVVIVTIPPR